MHDDDDLRAELEYMVMRLKIQARTYRSMARGLPADREWDAQRAFGHADGLLDACERLDRLLSARRSET
jgi:hypothetical protein